MVRHVCLLVLVALLGGCFTPLAVEAIEDVARSGRSEPVHEILVVRRVERAVRGGDGVYYFETTYSDGARRSFAYDPSPAVRVSHPLEGWPETGPGRLDSYPEGTGLPAGTQISVQADSSGVEGPCLRARQGWLELREGNGEFQQTVRFPRPTLTRFGKRSTTSYVKQILAMGLALPLAVAADLTLGAAFVFVRLGGLSLLTR